MSLFDLNLWIWYIFDMIRRWFVFITMLPLAALAAGLGFVCHQEAVGIGKVTHDLPPTSAAYLTSRALGNASAPEPCALLPELAEEPRRTPHQEAFSADGTLELIAFTTLLRATVCHRPQAGQYAFLLERGHLRPKLSVRPGANTSPTTHTVLLI